MKGVPNRAVAKVFNVCDGINVNAVFHYIINYQKSNLVRQLPIDGIVELKFLKMY